MKKKILYCCLIAGSIFSSKLLAQTELTGIQILRTARATYEQGRLHELPPLLENALDKNKFNAGEKVEAYKILVLTYIYLEEPQKADNAMLHLLRADHFFEVNEAVDPVEFQTLYKKFRTNPLFRIGIKFGGNITQVNTRKNYYIMGSSAGKGKYSSNIGIQLGATFEKDLTKSLVLNPELFFVTQSFTYNNGNPFSIDSLDKNPTLTHIISQRRIQLNALVQYKIGKSKLSPYVALGPSFGYLVSSVFQGETNIETEEDVTGSEEDNKKSYVPFSVSLILSGGVKYKIGGVFVAADIRYIYGLNNIVDGPARYRNTPENNELIYRYGYIDNDFSLNSLMVNFGLIYPFFNPKKLIK